MSEQIRGIILEGQSCSGKSSLFGAIKRCQPTLENAERNVIYLSEQYSQNLNCVNGEYVKLSRQDNFQALCDRLEMLEELNSYANSMGEYSRRARGLFYVFERFHLNYAFCFDNQSDEYKSLEERACELKGLAVLCIISEDKILERLSHRASFTNEIITQEIVDKYKKNQDRLIELAENSAVETVILNTDSMDWDRLARTILGRF